MLMTHLKIVQALVRFAGERFIQKIVCKIFQMIKCKKKKNYKVNREVKIQ